VPSKRSYTGARDIAELHTQAVLKITHSSLIESHPHDMVITKEAANYEWRR